MGWEWRRTTLGGLSHSGRQARWRPIGPGKFHPSSVFLSFPSPVPPVSALVLSWRQPGAAAVALPSLPRGDDWTPPPTYARSSPGSSPASSTHQFMGSVKEDKKMKKKAGAKEGKMVAVKKEKVKKERKVYELPGQKHDPPAERDPLRIFYESLYDQVPTSDMAATWLMEWGLLPLDVAKKVFEKKQGQKLKSPVKTIVAKRKPASPTSKSPSSSAKKKPAVAAKNAGKQTSQKKRKARDDSDEDDDDNFMEPKPAVAASNAGKQTSQKKRKARDDSDDDDDDDFMEPKSKTKRSKA